MAEINTGGGGKDGGKKRSKKMSTKVDMTPMVDLAFLLITFFMLTTTLAKRHAMGIDLPHKTTEENKTKVPKSRTLNVILGENDKIYYYEDPANPDVKVTNYSAKGIRQVFINKQKAVDSMIVIVKPMENSKYSNLVDVMDEVMITSKRPFYSIVDITPQDEELVAKVEGKQN